MGYFFGHFRPFSAFFMNLVVILAPFGICQKISKVNYLGPNSFKKGTKYLQNFALETRAEYFLFVF